MPVEQICILGATGSIGQSTLDVIKKHPHRFSVHSITASTSVAKMVDLCLEYQPRFAVMVDEDCAVKLASELRQTGSPTDVLSGEQGLSEMSSHPDVDIVMAAIVGAAGLKPNLAAVEQGKKVLLANKESLVMSGGLFMEKLRNTGARLLPIDSEHNAIFQCLPDDYTCGTPLAKSVRKVMLTASGGPFRKFSLEELQAVTPEQACKHPNWSMGQKISVDSATLMNKGLELIEACWLFNITPKEVDVVVHPESIIHSMVEYNDGSVLAQMGNPDMRIPIAYGLAYPERLDSGADSLSFTDIAGLHFEAPDLDRFPCLRLAQEAFSAGGGACAVLNAANEEAVAAFLKGNIAFTSIPDIIEQCLAEVGTSAPAKNLADILAADEMAREKAVQAINAKTKVLN